MKILSLFLIAVLATVALCVAIASSVSSSSLGSMSYDQLCDEIINLGKRAASYANGGDMDSAENTVDEAKQVFQQAAKLQPGNPQAHANMGVLLLNANRFNESIEILEQAVDMIPDSMGRAKGQLVMSVRKAKYGYASKNRDEVYQNGLGDVGKTYEFAQRQLEYSEIPHRTHFDAGTVASLLCEYDEQMCKNAENHLRSAFAIASSRYIAGRMPHDVPFANQREKGLAVQACMRSRAITGSWAGHKKVKTKSIFESIYIHEIKGHKLRINGRDGVITFPSDHSDCSVLATSSDYYINLADNLLDPRTEQPYDQLKPAKKVSDGMIVLSAIQYHSSSFYHWLCEVIPRLVIASIHYPKFKEAVVLIPKLTPKEKFITESLSMIFEDKLSLAEYVPFTEASQFTFVTWDAPSCPHKIGPCHALTNDLALLFARNEIIRSLRKTTWDKLKYQSPIVVLAMRGDSVTMRGYEEHDFVVKLEKAVMKAGAELILHDSGKMSFGNAMSVYRQAAVVVGVHGGALANIIACHPGTSVVEIGFTTAPARHYAHISKALALDYHLVEVDQDTELKRSLGAPKVTFDTEKVIELVMSSLKSSDENRARYADEFNRDTDPTVDPRAELEERMQREKEAEAYFGKPYQGDDAKSAPHHADL